MNFFNFSSLYLLVIFNLVDIVISNKLQIQNKFDKKNLVSI